MRTCKQPICGNEYCLEHNDGCTADHVSLFPEVKRLHLYQGMLINMNSAIGAAVPAVVEHESSTDLTLAT